MFRRLLVAVLFAAAWTGAARADGPYPAAPLAPLPGPPPTEGKPFIYKLFHPVQVVDAHTCWTHHNSDYNAATFRSEMTFIFSGSRSFFNEPCYKGGPPSNAPCTTGGCYK